MVFRQTLFQGLLVPSRVEGERGESSSKFGDGRGRHRREVEERKERAKHLSSLLTIHNRQTTLRFELRVSDPSKLVYASARP